MVESERANGVDGEALGECLEVGSFKRTSTYGDTGAGNDDVNVVDTGSGSLFNSLLGRGEVGGFNANQDQARAACCGEVLYLGSLGALEVTKRANDSVVRFREIRGFELLWQT